MIFFSFGLPSAFADWCERILTELARHALGQVEVVHANTLEDLGASVIRTGAPHAVFCSRAPDARLSKVLAEAQLPFLFILGDPKSTAAHLMQRGGASATHVAKVLGDGYAHLARYLDLPGAIVLQPESGSTRAADIVSLLNRRFALNLSEIALAEIVGETGEEPDENRGAVGEWWQSLSDAEHSLIEGMSENYLNYFGARELKTITWQRELFYLGDRPDSFTGPVDMTGRPRYLIRGPYIRLPLGAWTARIVLGCSKEATGVSLLVDICAGVRLNQKRVELERGGVFEFYLPFTIDEQHDEPIDIRIFMEKSAIDGLLSLSHVTLLREHEFDASKHVELTAELGLDAV